MKKTLLLIAALACSGVAQAETYVCSISGYSGGQIFTKYVRTAKGFTSTITLPASSNEPAKTLGSVNLDILQETEDGLILAIAIPNTLDLGVEMISKKTLKFKSSIVMFDQEEVQSDDGSCTEI